MRKCNNTVIQIVEKGYDVKEVTVPCGSTSIYGERLLCSNCQNDKQQSQDENIKADNQWLRSSGWGEL